MKFNRSFKTQEEKIKRNYYKELLRKKYEKNLRIAQNSVLPQLCKILFYGMISLSILFAAAEYFDIIKAQSVGSNRIYSFSTSINAAFYMWIIVGVPLQICCAVGYLTLKEKKDPLKTEKQHNDGKEEDSDLTDLNDKIKNNSTQPLDDSIKVIKVYSFIAFIGFIILGIMKLLIR